MSPRVLLFKFHARVGINYYSQIGAQKCSKYIIICNSTRVLPVLAMYFRYGMALYVQSVIVLYRVSHKRRKTMSNETHVYDFIIKQIFDL